MSSRAKPRLLLLLSAMAGRGLGITRPRMSLERGRAVSTCLADLFFPLAPVKCQPLLPAGHPLSGGLSCVEVGPTLLSFREQDCSVRLLWSGPSPRLSMATQACSRTRQGGKQLLAKMLAPAGPRQLRHCLLAV